LLPESRNISSHQDAIKKNEHCNKGCHEVESKLRSMKMDADESDQIIASHKENFLNEAFACSFARGKHRIALGYYPDYK
jgi:regulatory protein